MCCKVEKKSQLLKSKLSICISQCKKPSLWCTIIQQFHAFILLQIAACDYAVISVISTYTVLAHFKLNQAFRSIHFKIAENIVSKFFCKNPFYIPFLVFNIWIGLSSFSRNPIINWTHLTELFENKREKWNKIHQIQMPRLLLNKTTQSNSNDGDNNNKKIL